VGRKLLERKLVNFGKNVLPEVIIRSSFSLRLENVSIVPSI
jgi:hypothetical protein